MLVEIVMPIYGRIELSRQCAGYAMASAGGGIEIGLTGVFSRPTEAEYWIGDSIVTPNRPLGRKFNRGFQHLKGAEFDYAMILGSDDLVHPDYLRWVYDQPVVPYRELQGAYFFCAKTGQCVHAPRMLCGAGKLFSREFLERCDYKPYIHDAERLLDGGPLRFIEPHERQVVHPARGKPWLIDVKSSHGNMWEWNWVSKIRPSDHIDPEPVFLRFGEDYRDWLGL